MCRKTPWSIVFDPKSQPGFESRVGANSLTTLVDRAGMGGGVGMPREPHIPKISHNLRAQVRSQQVPQTMPSRIWRVKGFKE